MKFNTWHKAIGIPVSAWFRLSEVLPVPCAVAMRAEREIVGSDGRSYCDIRFPVPIDWTAGMCERAVEEASAWAREERGQA